MVNQSLDAIVPLSMLPVKRNLIALETQFARMDSANVILDIESKVSTVSMLMNVKRIHSFVGSALFVPILKVATNVFVKKVTQNFSTVLQKVNV